MFLITFSMAWAGPLHDAAKIGELTKVKQLIEKGALVNAKSDQGDTPILLSSWKGHLQITRLLIDKGADVNFQQGIGMTPLFVAVMNNHEEVSQLLIEKGANVNSQVGQGEHTPLSMVVSLGNMKITQLLLRNGANINAKGQDGRTPIFKASRNDNLDIVILLIAKGANINEKDHQGQTPLGFAIRQNKKKVAKLLRQHGGKVGDKKPKISTRHANSNTRRHLHNIYVACKALWGRKSSSASCTVKKAISVAYGFFLDKDIQITIPPGKDTETTFEAVAKHDQSFHSWRVNTRGIVTRLDN